MSKKHTNAILLSLFICACFVVILTETSEDSFAGTANVADPVDAERIITRAVRLKFSQICKGQLIAVHVQSGHIQISTEKMESRSSRECVVTDVAVAINRAIIRAIQTQNYGFSRWKWKDVSVTVGDTKYQFDKATFSAYRKGKLSDSEFTGKAKAH